MGRRTVLIRQHVRHSRTSDNLLRRAGLVHVHRDGLELVRQGEVVVGRGRVEVAGSTECLECVRTHDANGTAVGGTGYVSGGRRCTTYVSERLGEWTRAEKETRGTDWM